MKKIHLKTYLSSAKTNIIATHFNIFWHSLYLTIIQYVKSAKIVLAMSAKIYNKCQSAIIVLALLIYSYIIYYRVCQNILVCVGNYLTNIIFIIINTFILHKNTHIKNQNNDFLLFNSRSELNTKTITKI